MPHSPRANAGGFSESATAVRWPSSAARRAAAATLVLHGALLAAVHWLLHQQFIERAALADRQAVTGAFLAYGIRAALTEVTVFVAVALIATFLIRGRTAGAMHPATAWALAYGPIVMYSAGVAMALAAGWELGVWVFSRPGAAPGEVEATLREALPFVLRPLVAARDTANAAAVVLFAVLLRRQSGTSQLRAIVAGAAAGAVITIARLVP